MEQADTRKRIVQTAMDLFHRQGYHATGMAEILKVAEVGSGSFYHFFASKEAVLLAVLDEYVELLHPAVMQPAFALSDDPIERIFAVLDGYRAAITSSEFKFGCPIGNLALEVAASMPAAAEKIALNFTNWCKAIESCLNATGPRLPADLDRAQLARFVLNVMEGGIMQSRSYRSIEPYDVSVAMLRDYFDRLRIAPGREKNKP